jgi:short-subunit dehydrogenase
MRSSKSSSEFHQQSVLVTGAAAGMGRALCLELCRQGAHVYAGDIQQDKLQSLEDAAQGPGSITTRLLNVTDAGQFAAAFEQVLQERDSLDMVINNAGIVVGGDFRETSMAEIEKITSINYWGVMYGTKQAYDIMTEQGSGHIVNVASPAGAMPVPLSTAYSATKHAVVGLSHSLRAEAALYGVKVNVVLPGMVKSELWDNAINSGDYDYKKEMESTPIAQITSEQAAIEILQGISRNQEDIVFPFVTRLIVKLYRMFPGAMTGVVTTPLLKSLKQSLKPRG